jgi:glutathione S-transferase
MNNPEFSLQMSRVIKASRDRVFDAWVDPNKLQKWWAPPEVTCTGAELDVRVGGAYSIGMKNEKGEEFSVGGSYIEIDQPNKLVFTWDWDDEDMKMGDTIVTLEFVDQGESTEILLTHAKFPNQELCDGHDMGWKEVFSRFDEYQQAS